MNKISSQSESEEGYQLIAVHLIDAAVLRFVANPKVLCHLQGKIKDQNSTAFSLAS